MKATFELHGFDELEKKLDNLAKSISGTTPIEEIFTPDFMSNYTDYSDIGEFLKGGGFIVKSQKDFESIPTERMNEHVLKTTKFKDWEEMKSCAGVAYAKRKLNS